MLVQFMMFPNLNFPTFLSFGNFRSRPDQTFSARDPLKPDFFTTRLVMGPSIPEPKITRPYPTFFHT